MARLKAYTGIDMTDLSQPVGQVAFFDETTLVIRVGRAETHYFGDFSYPGGQWRGTITDVSQLFRGEEQWSVTGIELPTRYVSDGSNLAAAYRKALSGDDRMTGSAEDDAILGFAGNDRIAGGRGDDVLNGGAGSDRLTGNAGDDRIDGGGGRDVLAGGTGDDRLAGGGGADRFVFGGADGNDRIVDFRDQVDRIEITDGARRFSQLDIEAVRGGVTVSFGDTVITIAGASLDEIGARDFLF